MVTISYYIWSLNFIKLVFQIKISYKVIVISTWIWFYIINWMYRNSNKLWNKESIRYTKANDSRWRYFRPPMLCVSNCAPPQLPFALVVEAVVTASPCVYLLVLFFFFFISDSVMFPHLLLTFLFIHSKSQKFPLSASWSIKNDSLPL